jgi:hypothetical protein
MLVHEIGHYRPLTVLADRGVVQPESVAYGSAAHPEQGGMGWVVGLFKAAQDPRVVIVHSSIHGPTTVARIRH